MRLQGSWISLCCSSYIFLLIKKKPFYCFFLLLKMFNVGIHLEEDSSTLLSSLVFVLLFSSCLPLTFHCKENNTFFLSLHSLHMNDRICFQIQRKYYKPTTMVRIFRSGAGTTFKRS